MLSFSALKSSGKDSSYEASPDVLSDKGPVYYILIGSSAAALLVFGGLLTYYTVTVRRQRKQPGSVQGSVPDVVYVDTEPKIPSRTPSTRSDLPLLEFSQRPACLPLRPNGRKYSRDKSEGGRTSNVKCAKKTAVLDSQFRHDNFYIAPSRRK